MKNHFPKGLYSVMFLALALLLTNCGGKDDDDVKAAKEYLASSKWTLEDLSSDDLDAVSLALYAAFFEGYEVTYSADGTFEALLPAFGEFGTSEGTWELSADEKTLFHDKGTEDEELFVVKQINGSSLQLESTVEDDETGDSFTVLLKLKH